MERGDHPALCGNLRGEALNPKRQAAGWQPALQAAGGENNTKNISYVFCLLFPASPHTKTNMTLNFCPAREEALYPKHRTRSGSQR